MPDFLGFRAIWGRNSVVSHRVVKPYRLLQRGFTLIELVVITAIIAVITGLILASDSKFGGVVLLENLAYDMALSIRQAQVYGISVQRFGTNTFSAGYGVHFATADQYNYYTFADGVTTNGLYDCPDPVNPIAATCELVQKTQLERGFRIAKLCAPAGTDLNCTGGTPVSTLDILFVRPEPDAFISPNGVSCTISPFTCYTSARIVIASPRGDLRSIIVADNGQISVK